MKSSLIFIVLFSLFSRPAYSEIPSAYVNIGESVGVPPRVLYAVALTESRLSIGGISEPWPWTINVAGSPMRFRNREELIVAINNAIGSGQSNVDIGAMQVNFGYHGQRFESIPEAVNPYTNIRTGAAILREEYERCEQEQWWCAVGRYHSYRKNLSARYSEKVRSIWETL